MLVAQVGAEADEPHWHVDRYSQHRSCDGCGRSFEELSPHHFSFNSPLGWCPVCEGLGTQHGANPAVLVPDERRSLRDGAVAVWPRFAENPAFARMIEALAQAQGIDLDTPFDELEGRHRRAILHGTGAAWFTVPASDGRPEFSFQYKGLFPAIEEASRVSFLYRSKLQGMVDDVPCAACMGARLRDDAAAVRFRDSTIDQVGQWPLGRAYAFFKGLKLGGDERHIAGDLVREIRDRLKFLVDVGLDYLSLARGTPTLSGGESQRIRLASQIGSGLTGVLYVLDEPTIGLHPRDNARLLAALKHLRDLGNTLVLVEHDREVIEAADHLVDFGPGSGEEGGQVTASGTPAKVKASKAVADRAVPQRQGCDPRPHQPPASRRPGPGHPGGSAPQPQGSRRRLPPRRRHGRDGRQRLGQELACRGHPLEGRRQGPAPGAGHPRRPRRDRGPGAGQQGHQRRPDAPGRHADVDARHLLGGVRPDPRAVRQASRGEGPRLHDAAVQLQPAGRPVRGVRGGGPEADRDALPARRLDHLRGVRRLRGTRPRPWP